MVHAAAANTRVFATITGEALMIVPYATHSIAPTIWNDRSAADDLQKYDEMNTPVAIQPT
jgi:hypothetical protein